MEGYICPNCRSKFISSDHLTKHYGSCTLQEKPNTTAKQFNNVRDSTNLSVIKKATKEETAIILQNIGYSHSYRVEFEKLRNSYNSELFTIQNRGLLRLYKLTKLHEEAKTNPRISEREVWQSIVPWDTDAKSCAMCLLNFNFFRRQHHCRICGVGICDNCTLYLNYNVYFINEDLEFSINPEASKNVSGNKNSQLLICKTCDTMFTKLSKQVKIKGKAAKSLITCYKDLIHSSEEALRLSKLESSDFNTSLSTLMYNMSNLCKEILRIASEESDEIGIENQPGNIKLAKAINRAIEYRLHAIYEILKTK